MTRKRFIKLLMGNGWSRNWAVIEANEVILDNEDTAKINHKWKLQNIRPSQRCKFIPYEFCLPYKLQEKYKCGYCKNEKV